MIRLPRRSAGIALTAALLFGGMLALPLFGQSEPPPPVGSRDFVLDLPTGPPVRGDALTRRTESLSSAIRCPQCQGLSVADSPSKTALAMKEEVRDMLAEGYSEEQVLRYFEASYGEFIRLEPKIEGFNLVVWIAPFLAFAIGIAVVVLRLRGQATADRETDQEHDQAALDDDEAPLDDDLAAYREQVRREVAS